MIIAEVEAAEAAEKDVELGWQTRARISALRPAVPKRFRAMRRAKRAPGPGNFSRISMQPFLPTPSAHSVSLAQQPLRSPEQPSSSDPDADADADAAIELAHMSSARRRSLPDGEARVVQVPTPYWTITAVPLRLPILGCQQCSGCTCAWTDLECQTIFIQ